MRLARQRSHELVVLDLALPSQDGWSVLDEMKSDPALRETPVLIFTAFADQSERQRATARGAAGFITKPVGAVELNNAIRGILAGKVI
jgi:CheY-like chemotaxis protein